MSFFSGTDVVLFSPMKGKITFKGNPASGAKIIVHVFWKDDVGDKSEFITNENGEFNIPIKKAKVRIPSLAEFVVTQQVSVLFNDEEYIVWYKSLLDNDEYGGLGGYPQNVHCELTQERERKEGFNGIFSTSCKWSTVVKKGEQ